MQRRKREDAVGDDSAVPQRIRGRRPVPGVLLALGAIALAGSLAASCSHSERNERARLLEQGRAKLVTDASGALFIARDALEKYGDDSKLDLLAANACLKLGRRSEALDYADKGLALEDLDTDIQGDLEWARGTALMGRYRELNDPADWRSANATLELATMAGSHRAEAATLLVGLQDMGNSGTTERQLKFARLLFELEPDGDAAKKVHALLDSKGLKP